MIEARLMRAIVVAAVLVGAAPAHAEDPFGTADTFRLFGWERCGAPMIEQIKGACDPAPVDATLAPPERAAAHAARAKALVAFGRLNEAEKAADAAVEADPKNVAVLTFRARVALSQLRSEPAERYLNAALALDPANAAALANRAAALLERDREGSLRDITRALEIAPDDVDALWIKARIYVQLDQLERAAEDLTHALRIEPDGNRTRLFRAQVRLHQGRFEEAIADATTLFETHHDTAALEVRAIANTALDRHAAALADLEMMLGPPGAANIVGGRLAGLLTQRVILLSELGRKADAAKDIDTLLRIEGKRGVLRLQLYLRNHGFPDVTLSGERSTLFDEALSQCLLQRACARGLSVSQRS